MATHRIERFVLDVLPLPPVGGVPDDVLGDPVVGQGVTLSDYARHLVLAAQVNLRT